MVCYGLINEKEDDKEVFGCSPEPRGPNPEGLTSELHGTLLLWWGSWWLVGGNLLLNRGVSVDNSIRNNLN